MSVYVCEVGGDVQTPSSYYSDETSSAYGVRSRVATQSMSHGRRRRGVDRPEGEDWTH